MAKYEPLGLHLRGRLSEGSVQMSFGEIEHILKAKLPASAFSYREWWANQVDTAGRPQAKAWMDEGYEVESVHQDRDSGWVRFRRSAGS